MKTTFICLANSKKLNERCIAGIEISNGNIVIVDNKPKWVRPVSALEHGKVSTRIVSSISLLDIVEIEETKRVPEGFQSENILFKTNSIKVIGAFPLKKLSTLCNTTEEPIFGNKNKTVSVEDIGSLTHSLMMVQVDRFEFSESVYQNKSNVRLKFMHNSNEYDLPVTDIAFLDKYRTNKSILSKRKELYLVLSLAVVFAGWHYKLVAGIL